MNNLTTGDLVVRFSACGKFAERTATIDLGTPSIDPIQVQPNPPAENSTFQVGAGFEVPNGWTVTGANWDGSGDGSACTTDDSGLVLQQNGTTQPFQAHQAGPCHISLVVTFAPPNGGQPLEASQQADVNVSQTSTTTTAPPAPPGSGGSAPPRVAPVQTEATEPKG